MSASDNNEKYEKPVPADELESVHLALREDFAELATLYRRDSAERIAKLRCMWASGDHSAMAALAHAFAGSSASIRAVSLAALCKTMEQDLKQGRLASIDAQLDAIETEYRRIAAKLCRLLA